MKRTCMLLIATVLFALTAAFAQTTIYHVTTPFQFRVGDSLLPAGEYRVSEAASKVILLRGDGQNANAMVETSYIDRVQPNDKNPRLVFRKYGERYFLSEVWSDNAGHELFATRSELELARTMPPTTVKVVAELARK